MQSTCILFLLLTFLAGTLGAADAPYFITYSHRMEEPGNLELAFEGTSATPSRGNPFLNGLLEIEYGVTACRTTEVYLSGQDTSDARTPFTGHRCEQRFPPLMPQH